MAAQWPHGGNLRKLRASSGTPQQEILDFSANMNPLGFPEWLRPVVSSAIAELCHYPDPECMAVRQAAALHYRVDVDQVIAGNGSSELLYALPAVLGARRGVVAIPSYHDYASSILRAQLPLSEVPLDAARAFALDFDALDDCLCQCNEPCMVVLGRPNNPPAAALPLSPCANWPASMRSTGLWSMRPLLILSKALNRSPVSALTT